MANNASLPIRLLEAVWSGANRGTGHSWERLNHAMSDAMSLAVGSGMESAPGDFNVIEQEYRPGYWIRWENVYALAIAVGNRSVIEEFERHFARPPFIADRVRLHEGGRGFLHGGNSERARERLALGATFPWKGVVVKVTSFADDQASLTACSYRLEPAEHERCETCSHITVYPREILDKRFRITPADIKADRAERKKATAAKEVPHG